MFELYHQNECAFDLSSLDDSTLYSLVMSQFSNFKKVAEVIQQTPEMAIKACSNSSRPWSFNNSIIFSEEMDASHARQVGEGDLFINSENQVMFIVQNGKPRALQMNLRQIH